MQPVFDTWCWKAPVTLPTFGPDPVPFWVTLMNPDAVHESVDVPFTTTRSWSALADDVVRRPATVSENGPSPVNAPFPVPDNVPAAPLKAPEPPVTSSSIVEVSMRPTEASPVYVPSMEPLWPTRWKVPFSN